MSEIHYVADDDLPKDERYVLVSIDADEAATALPMWLKRGHAGVPICWNDYDRAVRSFPVRFVYAWQELPPRAPKK